MDEGQVPVSTYPDRRIRMLRRKLRRERLVFTVIIFVLLCLWLYSVQSDRFYGIEVNGRVVSWVRDKKVANQVLGAVKLAKAGKLAGRSRFAQVVKLRRTKRIDRLDDTEEALRRLDKVLKVEVKGVVILVDDEPTVALPTSDLANKALGVFKDKYTAEIGELVSGPEFKEKVEVRKQWIDVERMKFTIAEAIKSLSVGVVAAKVYEVKAGDTAWGIARRFKIKLTELQALNAGIDLERLNIGDELRLERREGILKVIAKARKTLTESIPFEVEVSKSSNLYSGERKILRRGKNGKREVEALITYENGEPVKVERVKERIIEKPVTQRVIEGTKPRPRVSRGERLGRRVYYLYRRGSRSGRFRGVYGMRELGVDVATAHSLNHAFGVHYGNGLSWRRVYEYLRCGDHSFGGRWGCSGGPHNPGKAAEWIRRHILK